MIQTFQEFKTGAILKVGDQHLLENLQAERSIGLFSFLWNTASSALLMIDGQLVELPPDCILSLTPVQHVEFQQVEQMRVYQFNREFYCIEDHDQEVSCAGLLFFGNEQILIIELSVAEQEKFELLHQVFLEELETGDNIQAEMLRMLTARFIIKTTRLMKENHEGLSDYESRTDLLRSFNMLVNSHFKQEHGVSYYANLLHKSPKTLSNVFGKLNISPLRIIHERIVLEAKRLLLYSDKSAKEIAYEVGFDDASHLSRMFKKHTGLSPSHFRQQTRVI